MCKCGAHRGQIRASDPWNRVTEDCEPPCGCRKLNLAPARASNALNYCAISLVPSFSKDFFFIIII